ncbi:SUMF1/EgtB/PvdO family nonheme iron enzyme [Candidatus Uabimicrobium sp. HlEnr_7]|uniref:SUMF1/EgtB/PvdO family nonheme iron enzyme n=1 Tax=Candidatus Uabimicrobium helgolandensis TaxID=3095367 RepID=UPI003557B8BE
MKKIAFLIIVVCTCTVLFFWQDVSAYLAKYSAFLNQDNTTNFVAKKDNDVLMNTEKNTSKQDTAANKKNNDLFTKDRKNIEVTENNEEVSYPVSDLVKREENPKPNVKKIEEQVQESPNEKFIDKTINDERNHEKFEQKVEVEKKDIYDRENNDQDDAVVQNNNPEDKSSNGDEDDEVADNDFEDKSSNGDEDDEVADNDFEDRSSNGNENDEVADNDFEDRSSNDDDDFDDRGLDVNENDEVVDTDFDDKGSGDNKSDEIADDFDGKNSSDDESDQVVDNDFNEGVDDNFESDFEKEFAQIEEDEAVEDGGVVEDNRDRETNNEELAVSQKTYEMIKNAYAKNNLYLVHKLIKSLKNKRDPRFKTLYNEIKLYRKSLRKKEVSDQIKNWSRFTKEYPQSVHIKFAESKLLFALGRHLHKMSKKERHASEILQDLPQNTKDLIDLAILVWKNSSNKSYLMLKSAQEKIEESDGALHQGIRGLQYYFYLRDIRRNLRDGDYKVAMVLKFGVSEDAQLDAHFLLQSLENKILIQKEKEEYEKALKYRKDEQYRKAFSILNKIKTQASGYYRDKADYQISQITAIIIKNGLVIAEKLAEEKKFSAAVEEYKSLQKYALSYEQKQLLDEKISRGQKNEFQFHYEAAQQAFSDKKYRLCLTEIVKAENLSKDKSDIYLQELRKLIEKRVFQAHEKTIRVLIDEEKLTDAEAYIYKIYSQHSPSTEHRNQIAKYTEFMTIYPKIIEAFKKKEYAKCVEFCQRALKYYESNPRINRVHNFAIEETNAVTRHIQEARDAIYRGDIVRALKELNYCKKISRVEIGELDELRDTWFLNLAEKYDEDLIRNLMFFVKKKDTWILDMTSTAWEKLSFDDKVKLSSDYQKAYAVQDNVPVENTFTIEKVDFEMVFIPPARFFMGSPSDEVDRFTDELRRTITIDTAYWMGKTEVSVEQWYGVTGRKIHHLEVSDKEAASTPASHVSWEDIQRYFLSKAHESFRLPTEAEWEYTCRAGTQTRFYWGKDPNYKKINDYAWYNENTEKAGEAFVHKIATKKPNHWGLHDMSGNLYEWCNDWSAPYSKTNVVNPQGPNKGKMKVYRGGLWFHHGKYCRSAARVSYYPDYRGYYIGFRLFRRHTDHKIVVAKMDWVASSVVEKVLKNTIEKEFNIPVEFLPVSQLEVWQKLETGIVDIHPDVWLPNHQEKFEEYVEKKKSIHARLSYRNAFQGFYIPEYIADKHNIYHVRDLQGKEHLFDINNDDVGDIWVGEPKWLTSKINEVKVKSYQLNLNPLTLYESEIVDIVRDRVLNRKPVLFYSWEPNPIVEWSTLRRLEEPEYDVEKWSFNQDDIENSKISCGYPRASVYMLASSHLKERHPQVFKFLMNWYFPIEELKGLMLKVESITKTASGPEITEIITTWIEENPSIIRDWLRGVR